ncbi:uncharacterized protein LOC122261075 [Penaeus japonicus]|uniref:uncharacterized protein LOC122261075 n=1 Tax=Penaeus japonicus TaxID=27405 RepID=UPI001C70BA4D|nr:uncharacterized protein LOC122261075 [Penaeus japonicus]
MIRAVMFASVVVFVAALGTCPLQRPVVCPSFRNSTYGRVFLTSAGLQCSLSPPIQCPVSEGNSTNGDILRPAITGLTSVPAGTPLPQCTATATQSGFHFGPQLYAFYQNASIVSNLKL